MDLGLDNLNEEQREAVIYNEGALAVLSSAGSGKTRVLTTKIAYLIEEMEVRPSRIFAVTFTKAAASEMKERLHGMIGDKSNQCRLSTIHSLAYKIWRDGKRIKEPWLDLPKPLIGEGRVLAHLYKYLKNNGYRFRDAKWYLHKIAQLKMEMLRPQDYRKQREALGANLNKPPIELEIDDCLYLIYKEYQNYMAKRNYIDFNDMLLNCYYMMMDIKYSDYIERLQNTVDYLLIDESQDTNLISFNIFRVLASKKKKITIVGDTRQAIYSFQGARVQNIKDFISEYSPKIIDLSINYRSTKTIVNNANKLIARSKEVIGKPATTDNEEGDGIELFMSHGLEEEGQTIFSKIEQLHLQEGVPWKDITVLYRLHSQSRELEDHFLLYDVPYISYSKTKFYQRREIQDLMAYLKLAKSANTTDVKIFKKIANRPTRYISNKLLDMVDDIADDLDCSIYEVMSNPWNQSIEHKDALKLSELAKSIADLSIASEGKTTAEILNYVLDNMGYRKWAIQEQKNKHNDTEDDIELNFESLVSSVAKFSDPDSFFSFIEDMKEKEKLTKDENGDFVKMMSIHRSKGKEFKHVFIIGVCDKLYPFHRAVNEGNEDEERRIMYVALTRPQKHLYISALGSNYGRMKVHTSPYIQDMNIQKRHVHEGELFSVTEIGKMSELTKIFEGA